MSTQSGRALIADSSSNTRMEVVRFSHVWTIENFSFFLKETCVSSPVFASGADDEIQWRLDLYPKGFAKGNEDHISVFLNLCSSGGVDVVTNFQIIFLSSEQKSPDVMRIYEPLTFHEGMGKGCMKFMRRDSLFKDQHSYLPDNKLSVYCEVWYAAGGVKISSQFSRQPLKAPLNDSSTNLGEKIADISGTESHDGVGGNRRRNAPKPPVPVMGQRLVGVSLPKASASENAKLKTPNNSRTDESECSNASGKENDPSSKRGAEDRSRNGSNADRPGSTDPEVSNDSDGDLSVLSISSFDVVSM